MQHEEPGPPPSDVDLERPWEQRLRDALVLAARRDQDRRRAARSCRTPPHA